VTGDDGAQNQILRSGDVLQVTHQHVTAILPTVNPLAEPPLALAPPLTLLELPSTHNDWPFSFSFPFADALLKIPAFDTTRLCALVPDAEARDEKEPIPGPRVSGEVEDCATESPGRTSVADI
jgi:hypothetical protein